MQTCNDPCEFKTRDGWCGLTGCIKQKPSTKLQFVYTSDVVNVVRCANCKWWNGSTLGVAHRCAALHIATTGEFYCAAAERKSNAFADQSGAEYADNPTV